MFSSLFTTHEHPDRKYGEAVLNGKGAIIAVIILFLYQFVIAYPLSYVIAWFNETYAVNQGFMINEAGLNLALQIIAIALMIFFFGKFYWANLKSYFKDFKTIYLWLPVLCYSFTLLGNFLATVILNSIRDVSGQTSNNLLVIQMVGKNPITMFVTVVILAPIVEETIFRAGLCRPMTVSKNPTIKALGYLISVGFFALLHVYQFAFFTTDASGALALTFNFDEFIQIIMYIPMALSFAICASVSKNFWVSVTMHMLTNGISISFMILLMLLQRLVHLV